jgi:class 3 adenylate cyclase
MIYSWQDDRWSLVNSHWSAPRVSLLGDNGNTAARMESCSEAGKLYVSGTTFELIKNRFNCTHRGKMKANN